MNLKDIIIVANPTNESYISFGLTKERSEQLKDAVYKFLEQHYEGKPDAAPKELMFEIDVAINYVLGLEELTIQDLLYCVYELGALNALEHPMYT